MSYLNGITRTRTNIVISRKEHNVYYPLFKFIIKPGQATINNHKDILVICAHALTIHPHELVSEALCYVAKYVLEF